jgi:hypothetical protein
MSAWVMVAASGAGSMELDAATGASAIWSAWRASGIIECGHRCGQRNLLQHHPAADARHIDTGGFSPQRARKALHTITFGIIAPAIGEGRHEDDGEHGFLLGSIHQISFTVA